MKVIRANIEIINEIRRKDNKRNLYEAIYYVSDTFDIIMYNALFLPFIYYAVENHFSVKNYILIALCLLLIVVFNAAYNRYYNGYIVPLSNLKIKHEFHKEICSKAQKMDMADITGDQYYDRFNMLLSIGATKLMEGLDMIWWGISVLILVIVYVAIIAYIDYALVLVAAICAVIAYFINLKYTRVEYQYNVETVKAGRKKEYFHRIFMMEQYASDLRTTGILNALNNNRHVMYQKLKNIIYSADSRKLLKMDLIKKTLLFLTTTTIVTIYLSWKYFYHHISLSVGDVIVAQSIMLQMSTILSDIAMIYPKLKQNMLYMNDYQEFMNYEPGISRNEKGICPETKANSIRLQNVTFGYDKEHPVLRNINMEVKRGEKVAIVGYNGAGKTTLVKIMLRLYLPDTGSVFMDDTAAEMYNLSAYRERFAIAFQESNTYALPVAENVLMDIYESDKKEQVEEALNKAGLKEKTEEYAKGILCEMTQEFDDEGMELSGGQTQKMALSRVYAKESGIVILDEPSSALDPISENEMIKTMMENTKGKTLLLISHRLSAVRDMDRIYFMEKGEIVEVGNHKELLERGGKYARMWYAQADKYQVKEN